MKELFDALSDGVITGTVAYEKLRKEETLPNLAGVMSDFLANLTTMNRDILGKKFYVSYADRQFPLKIQTILYASRFHPYENHLFTSSEENSLANTLTISFNDRGTIFVREALLDGKAYNETDAIPAFRQVLRWLGEKAPHSENDIQNLLTSHFPNIKRVAGKSPK
jgi:hypothetical protein